MPRNSAPPVDLATPRSWPPLVATTKFASAEELLLAPNMEIAAIEAIMKRIAEPRIEFFL